MVRHNIMKRLIVILFVLCIVPGILTAGPLLLLDSYSPKSFGLSGSVVAKSGDIDLMMENSSSIGRLKQNSASMFYLSWFEDMNFFSFSYGMPLFIKNNLFGSVGIQLLFFSTKPFPNYE